jgi:uncharacterized protein YdhG (YjbR/CyaY superfamily)
MIECMNAVDLYIGSFPEERRLQLEAVREAIREAAPEAEEVISYRMPAYKQHGMLVYFAGYKNHIGLYPTSSGILAFREKLEGYKCSRGTVQFPADRPLPLKLIREIVQYRVKENKEKAKNRLKKKK